MTHDVHLYRTLFIVYVIKIIQCCVGFIQHVVMTSCHHNCSMNNGVMPSRHTVMSTHHSVRFI